MHKTLNSNHKIDTIYYFISFKNEKILYIPREIGKAFFFFFFLFRCYAHSIIGNLIENVGRWGKFKMSSNLRRLIVIFKNLVR
jgi:hypothetical protein